MANERGDSKGTNCRSHVNIDFRKIHLVLHEIYGIMASQ